MIRKLSAVLVMVVAVVLAAYWLGRRAEELPASVESARPLSSSTATPSWPPAEIVEGDPDQAEQETLASFFDKADLVAKVTVETVEALRFNTDSGAMPTEDPMRNSVGLEIYAATVLSSHYVLKGPSTYDGFVVPLRGGEREGVRYWAYTGYVFEPDAQGVVFLRDLALHRHGGDPMWGHLETRATALSVGGASYTAMWPIAFYMYMDRNDVFNATNWETIPQPEFEATLTGSTAIAVGPHGLNGGPAGQGWA